MKGRKRTRFRRDKNREILKNRKWQVLCLILTIALIISVSLNIYQSLYVSNDDSGGNPASNSDASREMNFTFTSGPDAQKIVQGEFRLEIDIRWYGENLSMEITANDDDYEEWDYIGLVFDTNQDGHIDVHDEPYALYANNMTQPSALCEHGFLAFAWTPPRPGPQRVSFDPDTGYTSTIQFPCLDHGWDPVQPLKIGSNNPLHICFYDDDLAKAFVRFLFYLPDQT